MKYILSILFISNISYAGGVPMGYSHNILKQQKKKCVMNYKKQIAKPKLLIKM